MFSYVFMGEIVPMIEQRYPLQGARSVLGFSRSTVGALDAALNGSVRFARAAIVAPAMNPPTLESLVKTPRQTPRVTIMAATYDIPLIADAQALRSALQSRSIPQDWFEVPEGHNHTAWQAHLRRLLAEWF
jgi:enterochelin esterase-like enzyme